MNKKIVTVLVLISVSLFPFNANAQIPSIPIGGLLLFSTPCTCSGGVLMYVLDFMTRSVIPVTYQLGVSLYDTPQNSSGLFTPGTYQLGKYIPGAGVCLLVATPCISLNSSGTYVPTLPGFGNSLSPF